MIFKNKIFIHIEIAKKYATYQNRHMLFITQNTSLKNNGCNTGISNVLHHALLALDFFSRISHNNAKITVVVVSPS